MSNGHLKQARRAGGRARRCYNAAMTRGPRFIAILVGLSLLALSGGCRRRQPADVQVREAIEDAATGVRERKVKRVAAVVSKAYHDRDGNDRQAVVDLLRANILLRPGLFLVAHVASVVCRGPAECEAGVVAAMARVPSQTLSDLLESQADVYRFDLSFVDEEGAWRVRAATWHPANPRDLL